MCRCLCSLCFLTLHSHIIRRTPSWYFELIGWGVAWYGMELLDWIIFPVCSWWHGLWYLAVFSCCLEGNIFLKLIGVLLHGVCMISSCMHGFSVGTPPFSHYPWTCMFKSLHLFIGSLTQRIDQWMDQTFWKTGFCLNTQIKINKSIIYLCV